MKKLGSKGAVNRVAIIVLGLGDNRRSKLLENMWARKGIRVVFFEAEWKSNEGYQAKLNRLLDLIDSEARKSEVSLVGASAGGSLVINAFAKKKTIVKKVITVCSRLKKGQINGFRGFIERTKGFEAFRDSVISSEKAEKSFSENDRQKIMTIYALFGDELVPKNTTIIDVATNRAVPLGEHMISIAGSLTIFSNPLTGFITGG